MRKYRKYDWPKLLSEFKDSKLTQTQFCKDREINARYFNQQLNKRLRHDKAKFIAVDIKPGITAAPEAGFTLRVGRCEIQCPVDMPIQSLSTLIHSLA